MKKKFLILFILIFNVTFLFSNTILKDIKATVTGGITLKPSFDENIKNYTGSVQSDISEINLKILSADENSKIKINNKLVENLNSYNVPLSVGKNLISIEVDDSINKEIYFIVIDKENIRPVADKFLKFTYVDKETGVSMPYRLYIPEGYDGTKSYPLVLFLHGGGERGSDNEAQVLANQGATVWAKPEEQAKRPCFVLAPQAHSTWDGGFGLTRNSQNAIDLSNVFEPTKDLKLTYNVLNEVMEKYKVDKSRVYSTGVSQGGFGTWNLNILYPNLFAAMVPVCGGADPKLVNKLINKPIWAFHAEADPIIPVSYTRNMIEALKNNGAFPKYTEYNKSTYIKPVEHFSWVLAYQNEEMREWLFKQVNKN